MKWIIELHNLHKGLPIWIVGSDPTLEHYPNDFSKNKILITLHLAYVKFPHATYHYFNERDRFVYLKERFPEILDKINIFGFPFYNKTEEESTVAIGRAWNKGHRLKLRPYPPRGDMRDIFTESGPKAMRAMVGDALKGKRLDYGGHGTCVHPCMYVAIMMGGNPINIIGCNFQAIDGKEHFGEGHIIDAKMRPKTPSFTGYRGRRMTAGLNAIIAGCKDYNIRVNWIKEYNNGKFVYNN